MTVHVLLISKPIAPPFRDGTKCLVRDLALHLEHVQPHVMSTRDAPPLPGVVSEPAYSKGGNYAPTLRDNARAAWWVLTRARSPLWHFVFAPNPRTSAVGKWLSRVRRVPVLQTVASPPRDFTGARRLLFGDLIVAQSRWTRDQLVGACGTDSSPRIEVIPPPVGPVRARGPDAIRAQRHELGIPDDAHLFVFPGDLEVSRGAEAVAALVEPVVRELPDAVFAFACRRKTAAAPLIAQALSRRLGDRHSRFAPDPSDVLALIAGATAVLFPVDDLCGKVDLPVVLLEAMSLGVPVVAIDHGPLRDLEGALLIPPHDHEALVRAALDLARSPELGRRVVGEQHEAVKCRYRAAVVARHYERLYRELVPSAAAG